MPRPWHDEGLLESPVTKPAVQTPPVPKVRFSLRLKLGTMATFLSVVPLALVGRGLIDVNRDAVEDLNREAQLLVLEDVSRTVEEEFVAAEDGLSIGASIFTNQTLSDPQRLALLEALIEGHETIDHVALFDAEGVRIAVVEEEGMTPLSIPDPLPSTMREEMAENVTATGETTMADGDARVLLAVRIQVDGRTTGYVGTLLSLASVQGRLEHLADVAFAGSDQIFIVDPQLRVLMHADASRAMTSAAEEGILSGVTPEEVTTLRRSGEFAAADGTPMLGTTTPLPERGWAIVVQVPQSLAYASIERMTSIVRITVGVAILVALSIGLLVATRLASPVRLLEHSARTMAGGDLEHRADIRRSDEIGALAATFNHMAAALSASFARLRATVVSFERFVPRKFLEVIATEGIENIKVGSRATRPLTILFSDIRGYTSLSERSTNEEIFDFLNEYLPAMGEPIEKAGGFIDKYIGDAIMALFDADTTDGALDAALGMKKALIEFNESRERAGKPTVDIGVGLHRGEVVMGTVGFRSRIDSTVIGDPVNLASRVEGLTKQYGQILITEAVRDALSDADRYQMKRVDEEVKVKGKEEPVVLFVVDDHA